MILIFRRRTQCSALASNPLQEKEEKGEEEEETIKR